MESLGRYTPLNINSKSSAVPWLRWLVAALSQRRLGFAPGSDRVGFWWTKWQWDRFYPQFFGFSLSLSFHHGTPYSCRLGMSNRVFGGRRSETKPHLADINKYILSIRHTRSLYVRISVHRACVEDEICDEINYLICGLFNWKWWQLYESHVTCLFLRCWRWYNTARLAVSFVQSASAVSQWTQEPDCSEQRWQKTRQQSLQ
jgi:hypothetical protein